MKKLMLQALCLFLAQGATALRAVGPSECGAILSRDLIVGSNFAGTIGYVPFEVTDTKVTPLNVIGFDAAVACEVASRLGFVGVSFRQDNFEDLLPDLTLADSPFDIVMSAMSITPARKTEFPGVSFVKYNQDTLGLVYIKGSEEASFTNPAEALEDLAGIRTALGVIKGSRQERIIQQNNAPGDTYEGLFVFTFNTLQEALDNFISANPSVQALFVDGATAVALAAGNFNLLAVNEVVDTANTVDQTTQGLGIAIPSTCCQLYVNIQKAISDMNADGTLERLRAEFNVPRGFTPVSGLAPANCTLAPTINSNAIANYLFTNYCPCTVTPLSPINEELSVTDAPVA